MCIQAHREGGYFLGAPKRLEAPKRLGAHEAFNFVTFWAASLLCFFFIRFPLHCLHSMSERLGRIMLSQYELV